MPLNVGTVLQQIGQLSNDVKFLTERVLAVEGLLQALVQAEMARSVPDSEEEVKVGLTSC